MKAPVKLASVIIVVPQSPSMSIPCSPPSSIQSRCLRTTTTTTTTQRGTTTSKQTRPTILYCGMQLTGPRHAWQNKYINIVLPPRPPLPPPPPHPPLSPSPPPLLVLIALSAANLFLHNQSHRAMNKIAERPSDRATPHPPYIEKTGTPSATRKTGRRGRHDIIRFRFGFSPISVRFRSDPDPNPFSPESDPTPLRSDSGAIQGRSSSIRSSLESDLRSDFDPIPSRYCRRGDKGYSDGSSYGKFLCST